MQTPRRRTIRDVAEAAGVSIATASNALNETGRINSETKARVRRIAAEIGFRPNGLARSLVSRRSKTVGIVTNDTYGRLTLPMTSGVSEVLLPHGISVFLCPTNGDPRLVDLHLDALLDRQVDGLIFTATRIDQPPPAALAKLPIPIVHAFSEGPADRVSFVPDDAQGACLAVDHLLSRGYRRLAHVTGPLDYVAAQRRLDAFRGRVGEAAPVLAGQWTEEWGHEAVTRILAMKERPDAVFCGSDEIARGMIDAFRDHGIGVPHDVAIVGFDNWEVVSRQTRPALTTVDMGLGEIGRQAGLAILALTQGETLLCGIRKLACALVVRSSVEEGADEGR